MFRCPSCGSSIDVYRAEIRCAPCTRSYPRLGAIPILLADPDAFLTSCQQQIAAFERQADLTLDLLGRELSESDASFSRPLARVRVERMMTAVRAQVADVRALLEPVLPRPWPERVHGMGSSEELLPGPLKHVHYLFRDWGWPPGDDGENERALELVRAVVGERPLGRTIVLGAGACRLAYDLHRSAGATETLAVDLDPLLLTVAHTIVRGGGVSIHEANAEIDEMDRVARQWTLAASHSPVDQQAFDFVLADALEPPIQPGMFDTVVTPWFIDQIPPDLREFISTIYRLLAPGGRWVSLGPLRYAPDRPVALRFTREEVFDLAALAGFTIDASRAESQPYLVSKLSLRGKVEWVLAFAATRRQHLEVHESSPPAWLLFNHLPVPSFAGQEMAAGDDAVRRALLASLDGRRTIADLAEIVASHITRTGVSAAEIRSAVRRYLADVHPAARSAR